ncbi:MAG: diguanylate cyclase [Clostridia bacterium]|nr:diguanylate cyclase [Clostridia bacterium]
MNKRVKRWKFLLPLIIGMVVMSAAFALISYDTFRDVEIEDYANYAKGLTGLIAEDIIRPNDVEGYLRMGRAFPKYNETEQKLYKLRDAYPDVIYLYAYRPQKDGLHVVFDLDTEQFKGSDPGSVEYFFPDFKPYIQDMLDGKEIPPIMSHEEYGYVLTVLTPIYDSRGICQCYVGADCSMDQLTGYVWKIIRQVAHAFVIVFAVALIAAIVMTNISFKRMKKLENRAYIDTLTGLQNRTAFYENMGGLTKKIEDGTADFSTLMIDVNYLKKVNDVYGHEQGNTYLQNAANLIRKHFGNEGLYRIGGDEFAMLLEGKAQEGTEEKIRAFKEEMAQIRADESLQPWEKPSAAVGLAKYIPGEHDMPDAVLRQADEYMYADKVAMKAVRTD